MKSLPTLTTALLVAALATACARDADTANDTNATDTTAAAPAADAQPAATPAPDATAPAAGAIQPGEITGLVAAVDMHEIEAAEQARSKNVTGEVKDYADMLHTAHTANLAKTNSVGAANGAAPVESGPVQAQKEKGKAELATLAALEGKAYEKAYVDAMVKGHTEALAKLDNELIPAATNDAIKAHLTETRGHIAMHLERGQALQGSMN